MKKITLNSGADIATRTNNFYTTLLVTRKPKVVELIDELETRVRISFTHKGQKVTGYVDYHHIK